MVINHIERMIKSLLLILVLVILCSCYNNYSFKGGKDLFTSGEVLTDIGSQCEEDYGNCYNLSNLMDYLRRNYYYFKDLKDNDAFDSFYMPAEDSIKGDELYYYFHTNTKYYEFRYREEKEDNYYIPNIERKDITKSQYDSIYNEALKNDSQIVFDIEVRNRGKKIRVKKR